MSPNKQIKTRLYRNINNGCVFYVKIMIEIYILMLNIMSVYINNKYFTTIRTILTA